MAPVQVNLNASSPSSALSPDGSLTFPFQISAPPLPFGGLPLGNSVAGSTGALTATLNAAPGQTVYITGFHVGAGGATAAGSAIVTVAGVVGGTQSFVITWGVVNSNVGGVLDVIFSPPLSAVSSNTPIVVTFPGQGAGGVNETLSITGFSTPTFDPRAMGSGLIKAWFDSSDATTIIAAAGAVGTWNDKSGAGVVATQATAAKKPTIVTGGQNGLNTIRFTAANLQQMDFGATVNPDPTFTIFFVTKKVGAIHIGLGNNAGGASYGPMLLNDNKCWVANAQQYSTIVYSAANYHLITMIVDRPTTLMRTDTVPQTVSTTIVAGFTPLFNTLGVTQTPIYGDGETAELILYTGALSTADVVLVETYLRAKWATP